MSNKKTKNTERSFDTEDGFDLVGVRATMRNKKSAGKSSAEPTIRVLNVSSEVLEHPVLKPRVRFTKKLARQIATGVQTWLNTQDTPYLQMTLADVNDKNVDRLSFWRVRIRLKTCANWWTEYHMTEADGFSHPFISVPRRKFQSSTVMPLYLPNEVHSDNYDSSMEQQSTNVAFKTPKEVEHDLGWGRNLKRETR
jgi:hypothetical protein